MFIYSSCGKWDFPLSCGVFLPPPLSQAFPLLIAGRVLLLLPAGLFIYSSRGKWVFPPLLWIFLPLPLSQAFPLLVAGRTPLLLPSPARPSLFIYSSGKDSLPPLSGTEGAPPSLQCVFIVLIAYYSVSLFSPGGDRSVQGAMLVWSRDVCGSTAYHLAHLVLHVFPSHLGVGIWWPGGPPSFSVLREVEMFCAGWRCGGVKVLPLLGGLAYKVWLQHLSKISLQEACFLLSPSSGHQGGLAAGMPG
jgi:hypothetical protein